MERLDMLNALFAALRPHQWLKNLLVFLPLLAAHQFDVKSISLAIKAFISFSLIASAVYVVNDLVDLEADRAHPRKKNRPFASGRLRRYHGIWLAGVLIVAGILLAISIGLDFVMVMMGYLFLTTTYSLYLKRYIVIDIFVLASLYVCRIFAGGLATQTPLSVWLLAFALFFFLALAAVKRQTELVDSAQRGKVSAAGRGYHVDDLPIIAMIAIAASYVSVLVLALYVSSPAVLDRYASPEALWGVCGVLLFWLTRTVVLAHRGGMDDDPIVYAVKDWSSRICLLFVLVFLYSSAIL
jgi:4-hydroxybenzoate polyprenyltransferase